MHALNKLNHFSRNRWLRLATYSLATWLTTCIYYGWNQYQHLLYKAGAYEWECNPSETLPCEKQKQSVASYYSVASGTEFLFAVVAGVLLDNLGPRACGIAGEIIWGLGLILQYFSSESFRAYNYSAFLLGAGVNLVAFPTLIVEEIFPRHKNMMISLMIATQTAATAIAPVVHEIVKVTGVHPGVITRFYFFVVYIPVALLLIWTLPWKRPSLCLENLETQKDASSVDSHVVMSEDEKSDEKFEPKPPRTATPSYVSFVVKNESYLADAEVTPPFNCKSFAKELLTVEWILFTAFYQLSIAGFTYWSAVIADRYGDLYSEFIGWSTLIQGPMGILFGLLSDQIGSVFICLMIVIAQLLTFLVGMSEKVQPQYVVGLIATIMQSWIWTTKYCYVVEVFSRTNFGKLVGIIGAISGFVTYLNMAFISFGSVEAWFGMFIGFSVINIAICGYLFYRSKWLCINHKKYVLQ